MFNVRSSLYIFFILKNFNAYSVYTVHLQYTYSNQCLMYVPYPQCVYSSFLKFFNTYSIPTVTHYKNFKYLQYTYSMPMPTVCPTVTRFKKISKYLQYTYRMPYSIPTVTHYKNFKYLQCPTVYLQ